jgi:hypothetical protein
MNETTTSKALADIFARLWAGACVSVAALAVRDACASTHALDSVSHPKGSGGGGVVEKIAHN